MQLFLSLRASLRVLFASGALVGFLPVMALASSSPAAGSAPAVVRRASAVLPRPAPPSFDTLSVQCDQESTHVSGSWACATAAFTYLRDKGLSPDEAAGVVGNLWLESHGVSPKSRQFGGGPGRGIAQWTVYERWQGVVALAGARGVAPETLRVQLDYLWHELHSTHDDALGAVQSAPSVVEATLAFQNEFEIPIGTDIGGSPYTFNVHPWAHTADRVEHAERVQSWASDEVL